VSQCFASVEISGEGVEIALNNTIDGDEILKKKRTRRRSIPRAGGSSTP
jgi:hypothetical protein